MDIQGKLESLEKNLKKVQEEIQEKDKEMQELQIEQVKCMGAIEALKELIESEEVNGAE